MKRCIRIVSALGFVAVALSGCDDNKPCQEFAEHVADVLVAEKGEAVDAAIRDKMVRKTTETCAKEPPKQEVLDCAMAAKTSQAITACDPPAVD